MSFLHDIWNPWHGCVKCSEGCQNCYMYFLDRMRDQNGAEIYKTKSGFSYPLQKDRAGHYKIQSGEQIRVCMTSDFFLEEADPWRAEAWDIMRQRSDVVFFLLTKRPQRVRECLPPDWGSGWDNIFFNVTCENQRRADERIPILFDLPFKHKGIKQLIKWWMSRKTNARIEDAHADVEEFKALREYNEFLQKQLSEKEQRFVEQTDRLRKAQDELFTLKETNSDLKLELALKRCERKKCGDREPQNGY